MKTWKLDEKSFEEGYDAGRRAYKPSSDLDDYLAGVKITRTFRKGIVAGWVSLALFASLVLVLTLIISE